MYVSGATLRPRSAALVLPIFFRQEHNIYAPNNDFRWRSDCLGGINQISPNDIPARVIVVRLQPTPEYSPSIPTPPQEQDSVCRPKIDLESAAARRPGACVSCRDCR